MLENSWSPKQGNFQRRSNTYIADKMPQSKAVRKVPSENRDIDGDQENTSNKRVENQKNPLGERLQRHEVMGSKWQAKALSPKRKKEVIK